MEQHARAADPSAHLTDPSEVAGDGDGVGDEDAGSNDGPRRSRNRVVFAALGVLLVVGIVTSLGVGSVSIAPTQVLGVLLEKMGAPTGIEFSTQQSVVLWNIRLPRVLMGIGVGAALALAGASLQVAFRNQMADPTLLGISGAALMGLVLAFMAGAVMAGGRWVLPVAACLGAVASAVWLVRFSLRQGRSDRLTLILTGVALQLFLAGAATLLVSAFHKPGMPDASFLTMGGLSGVFWRDLAIVMPAVAALAFLVIRQAPILNIMLLDDNISTSLGVDVARRRMYVAVLAAVATGIAVAYAGAVAFVGLVVPYLLRGLVGDDHRRLVPAALLGGAILIVFGDTLARVMIAPMELPLGVLMTIVGGPVFFWLIGRSRGVAGW